MHPPAGNLVYADQHRFARFPAGGGVLDKIGGDLLQSVVRRYGKVDTQHLMIARYDLTHRPRFTGVEVPGI